jgi:hypothetical protein
VIPRCRLPVVLHDLCWLKGMHVEVMELHDRAMIAECCLSDVDPLIGLGFGMWLVLIIRIV